MIKITKKDHLKEVFGTLKIGKKPILKGIIFADNYNFYVIHNNNKKSGNQPYNQKWKKYGKYSCSWEFFNDFCTNVQFTNQIHELWI